MDARKRSAYFIYVSKGRASARLVSSSAKSILTPLDQLLGDGILRCLRRCDAVERKLFAIYGDGARLEAVRAEKELLKVMSVSRIGTGEFR